MSKSLIFTAFVLLLSCTSKVVDNKGTQIIVDLSTQQNIDVNDYSDNLLILTKGDKPFLSSMIKKVLFTNGNGYIICDDIGVNKFNIEDGQFINSFSSKGRAKNEYLSLWDIWLENDTLFLYDMNGKKIIVFDENGSFCYSKFISDKFNSNPFQMLVPYKNGYIGKRTYSNPELVSELSLYNSNFEYISDLIDDKLESGIFLGYPFATTSKGDILYNRYFKNEIFTIDDLGNFKTKYYVDFMKQNIPKQFFFKDTYEIIDFVNKEPDKYAGLISSFYETDYYLCLRFLYQSKIRFLVYDKKNSITMPFVIDDFGGYVVRDISFHDDKVFCFLENDDNSAIFSLKIEEILN